MNKILILFIMVFMVSCETDSGGLCSSDAWAGSYTIVTANIECNSTLIVAIVSGNTLTLNTVEGEIDGCTFNAPTFQVEASLNGTSISFSGLGCTATYNKN